MKDKDSLNENQRGAFCSSLKVQQQLGSFLFCLGFLSQTFAIHGTDKGL